MNLSTHSSKVAPHSILKTSSAVQIPSELGVYFEDLLNVFHTETLVLVDCEVLCRSNNILDLASIQFMFDQLIVVLVCKLFDRQLTVCHNSADEHFKDSSLCFGIERIVAQGNVNPRSEGIVKSLHVKLLVIT